MRQWIVALAALSANSGAPAQTNSPWLTWVYAHSPHGIHVSPDGTIWINSNKPGLKEDYAIRAGDLREARASGNKNPEFWVRGYHRNNPAVRYRESIFRYVMSCANETYRISASVYYGAYGEVMGEYGSQPQTYVVFPGSYASEWHRLFCRVTD